MVYELNDVQVKPLLYKLFYTKFKLVLLCKNSKMSLMIFEFTTLFKFPRSFVKS